MPQMNMGEAIRDALKLEMMREMRRMDEEDRKAAAARAFAAAMTKLRMRAD